MKKLTTILISCSLALAVTAVAAPPNKEEAAGGKKKQAQAAKPAKQMKQAPKSQPMPKQAAVKPQHVAKPQPVARPQSVAKQEHAMKSEAHSAKTKAAPVAQSAPVAPAVAKTESAAKVHGKKGPSPLAPGAATATTANPQVTEVKKEHNASKMKPAVAAKTAPANATAPAASTVTASQANLINPQPKPNAKPRLDTQAVQQIRTQRATFQAQPRPQQVPTATFNPGYRIQGADNWQGARYGVFRSYHPELHDRSWYHSHYNRVELFGGGYYYWNNGYWYPAWGYSPSEQYYAYDGPIYVGHHAEPPDRIIAQVQSYLQQQGYYRGEVDGLLGPLTREALTSYQNDYGLYPTAAIDEPTLESLGLS